MKRLLLGLTNRLGRAILRKHRPVVVAVTGSVGKTTTKEAIYCAVRDQRPTIRSLGSLNAQWGVLLALVGYEKKSGAYARLTVGELLGAYAKGLRILLGSEYARVVVLEMGADQPGDLAYLTGFYPPDVAVITNIGQAHLAQFESEEAIAHEKWSLVRGLKRGGVAVLNSDDAHLKKLAPDYAGRVVWYGTREGDVVASAIESRPDGVSYRLRVGKYERRVSLEARGGAGVFASLAAIGVAVALDLDLERAIVALEELEPPEGRLTVHEEKSFTVIDDTYNASPASMKVALDYLKTFHGRKVAILGEMRELGPVAPRAHREVGEWAREVSDRVLVVGEAARGIIDGAGEQARFFPDVESLQAGLAEEIRAGDVVLVKASRGVYLDRVVKTLLEEGFREKIRGTA